VLDDFCGNGDRIERLGKALLQDVEGLFVQVAFHKDVGEFDIGL
jgi:hypothetical protein